MHCAARSKSWAERTSSPSTSAPKRRILHAGSMEKAARPCRSCNAWLRFCATRCCRTLPARRLPRLRGARPRNLLGLGGEVEKVLREILEIRGRTPKSLDSVPDFRGVTNATCLRAQFGLNRSCSMAGGTLKRKSREASRSLRSAPRSTSRSVPCHLRTLPATITVSTLLLSISDTTAPGT